MVPQLTGTLKGDKAHPGVFDNTKIKRLVPEFHCRKPFRSVFGNRSPGCAQHPEQQNLSPELDALIERVIGAWRREGAPFIKG